MSLLTLQDVSQTYGERQLLREVSLVIGADDRIGVLGPNGSGKSTLLRILGGLEVPDDGQRTTRRGLRLGYLEQDPKFEPTHSVRDAVRLAFAERDAILTQLEAVHEALCTAEGAAMEKLLAEQSTLDTALEAAGGHDVEHRIDSVIHDLGLEDATALCGSLSGGERRRVALARLLLEPVDLLILDEPTNHLDAEVTDWLEDRLLGLRCALVLVTHDRYFLDRIVQRTIEIESGALHEYDGGYTEFLEARAARLAQEQSAEDTRLNILRRETEWMRRGPPARTTKAKARIDRFHGLQDAAPEAASRELSFTIPGGPRLGERVIRFENVTAGYGEEILLQGLDIEIGARTRLGIVGPNGAGKSTFLKLCLSQLQALDGTVHIGSTVKFASIDQRRSDLDESKTVLDEVSGSNDYIDVDGRKVRIESFLDQFLFPGAMKRSLIGDLSGGERNRVLLAKLLSAGGNVLILDEPTNDLDLMTLRVLEEALVAFPGVVLVVSHDRYFLDRVATRILHLDGEGNHRIHEGDLSMLLEKIGKEREAAARHAATKTPKKSAAAPAAPKPAPSKPTRKLSTREHKELERLPEDIAAAEAELESINAKLVDPAIWQAGSDVDPHELNRSADAQQKKVAQLYARWEELELIREG